MKELFNKIHTERYRWYDNVLIISIVSFVLIIAGQMFGLIFEIAIDLVFGQENPAIQTFAMYFSSPFGVWVIFVLFLYFVKHRRPILKAITPKAKGNTVGYLLLGLLIGFGLNFVCALAAMAHRDIHVSFDTFNPFYCLLLLFGVFIQSSSEELVDRGYMFQVLKKGYRNKWVAIIGNALIFSLMHGTNPGVHMLGLLNVFFSGLMFSLFVYFFDSIWCAFGIHTGWNFTQSILLGLPNSGNVVPYSFFALDTATATDSLFYNISFGIEGTVFSTILLAIACVVVYIIGSKRNQEPLDVYAGFEAENGKRTDK